MAKLEDFFEEVDGIAYYHDNSKLATHYISRKDKYKPTFYCLRKEKKEDYVKLSSDDKKKIGCVECTPADVSRFFRGDIQTTSSPPAYSKETPEERYKVSTSESEEKPTEVTSESSTAISYNVKTLIYESLSASNIKDITDTKFASDSNYTISSFLLAFQSMSVLSVLLKYAKKCLVYILIGKDCRPSWYAWDGKDLFKYGGIQRNDWVSSIIDEGNPRRKITLYDILNDFPTRLGFYVDRIEHIQIPSIKQPQKEISKMEEKVTPSAINPAYEFVQYTFDSTGDNLLKTGEKLLASYNQWKSIMLENKSLDPLFVYALKNDRIKSSRSLTEKFNARTHDDPGKERFYRYEYNADKYAIYKNPKYKK